MTFRTTFVPSYYAIFYSAFHYSAILLSYPCTLYIQSLLLFIITLYTLLLFFCIFFYDILTNILFSMQDDPEEISSSEFAAATTDGNVFTLAENSEQEICVAKYALHFFCYVSFILSVFF